MQASSWMLGQFQSLLLEFEEHWKVLGREQLEVRISLPELSEPVFVSVVEAEDQLAAEWCDDSWDQLATSEAEIDERGRHLGLQACRRILWKPRIAEEDAVSLFAQGDRQIQVNDLHQGELTVFPDYAWLLETMQLMRALNEIVLEAAKIGQTEQLRFSAQKHEERWQLLPVSEEFQISGPACVPDAEITALLSQMPHSRETAQLDVVSLIDWESAEHGSVMKFRMFVLICSNRHSMHHEFDFVTRQDLISGLAEGLKEFFCTAGIPARLQLSHPLLTFILQPLASALEMQLISVESLILTDTLCEELEAALLPLDNPQQMN